MDDPTKIISMNMPLYGLVQKMMKFLKHSHDDKYLVMPNQIRKWMNSVVDQAILDVQQNFHTYGILNVRFFLLF